MNKHKLKGIIFDLDGTLADTLEDISDSMNRVLQKEGFPVYTSGEYKNFIGSGIRNLVRLSLPENERSDSMIKRCTDLMGAVYTESCLIKTNLYDGISEIVDTFRLKGIKLAVFSNKADEFTQRIVRSLLHPKKFEMILGAKSSIPAKPDPAGALLISKHFGIDPQEIGFIGDSDIDMITANKAAMFAIGALWGFKTKAELIAGGAKVLVERPRELLEVL